MTKSEAVKYVLVRSLGNFLVLLSLYGVGATFGPSLYYEIKYQTIKMRGITYQVSQVPQVSRVPQGPQKETSDKKSGGSSNFAQILAGAKEQVLVPPDTAFSIVIPKIGASARVIPNVDPVNEAEFKPVLEKGIAHARGSVFPGMEGNIYLFAHSTDNWWNVGRYNAVFYLLRDLKPGDEVSVFFEDRRHEYKVYQSILMEPNDVSLLVSRPSGEERLIMQTCWPPGTTWKRLAIIAVPK